MNELLTIGQMIDQLNVGQTARAFTPEGNEIPRLKVAKNDAHSIMVVEPWEVLCANGFTLGTKWKLEPQYVSFEEAMRVHKDKKKTITYHHDADLKYIFKYVNEPGQFEQLYYDSISLQELLNGKWTIED